MRLEEFFDKFELFAEAPNAVAKMRELVLRLAFNGGLSGASLSSDGLPVGWELRTVESICTSIVSGFACSKTNQVENGHVHLRTHNISTLGTLNFDLLVRVDPNKVDSQKSSIQSGDILFNNTNSQELVGKTCLVDKDYDYGFSNHLTRLRLNNDAMPNFVVYYLTFLRNSGYFSELCTRWINQAAINTNTLKKQTIPLPPLAEQKRIVAKMDELMALCDRLEAQQQERATRHAALARASLARFTADPTTANLEYLFHNSYAITPADLRKTILTLAVQGKLSYQNPSDMPATDILGRSNDDDRKSGSRRGKGAETNSIKESNLPFELPPGWEWCRLGQLNPSFQNGASSRGDKGGVPVVVLRLADVEKRRVNLNNTRTLDINQEQIGRYLLKKGDILITRVNGSADIVGSFVLVEGDMDLIYCDHFIRMRIADELIEPQYLDLLGASELVRGQIASLFITTAGQKTVNQGHISSLLISLPPLAEQHRIVTRVNQLMAQVDQLEAQLTVSRTTAERLMEATVAELTAQKDRDVA